MTSRKELVDGSLIVEQQDGSAWVTINRPERRNAITQGIWQALPALAASLDADDATRVVVVRGAGDQAFSAGAAIEEFPQTYKTPDSTRAYNTDVQKATLAIANLSKPAIAAIHGHCVGGGCALAMACDLRFSGTSGQFGIPPARLGAAYSFSDTKRLYDLVGPARAKDLLFSGRVVAAAEALTIGLADRVVADADLAADVHAYCDALSHLSQNSIRTAKHTVAAIQAGVGQESAALRQLFDDAFAHQDFAEGYAAFLEKRKPRFR